MEKGLGNSCLLSTLPFAGKEVSKEEAFWVPVVYKLCSCYMEASKGLDYVVDEDLATKPVFKFMAAHQLSLDEHFVGLYHVLIAY